MSRKLALRRAGSIPWRKNFAMCSTARGASTTLQSFVGARVSPKSLLHLVEGVLGGWQAAPCRQLGAGGDNERKVAIRRTPRLGRCSRAQRLCSVGSS